MGSFLRTTLAVIVGLVVAIALGAKHPTWVRAAWGIASAVIAAMAVAIPGIARISRALAVMWGVILTGGGALLNGMADRLHYDLNLNVTVPEDPLTTVALGAGRLLAEPERLHRASLRLDGPAWEQAEKLVVNW